MSQTKMITRKVAEASAFWFAMTNSVFAQGSGGTATEAPPATIQEGIDAANPGGPSDLLTVVKNIVNVILFIVGFVAVVMLIVGGVRYVVSAGNDEAVGKAKNTILYAIIGLVIAILAFAAVNFIITALTTGSAGQ